MKKFNIKAFPFDTITGEALLVTTERGLKSLARKTISSGVDPYVYFQDEEGFRKTIKTIVDTCGLNGVNFETHEVDGKRLFVYIE